MICMCAFINARNITFDSSCEVINSVLTIVFMVLCNVLPLILTIFLLVRLPTLGTAEMKKKYGNLTEGLDLSKGRVIVLSPINFLLRRQLLIAGVVLIDYVVPQYCIVLFGVMVNFVSSGFFETRENSSLKLNDFFNEIIIVLTLYTMMCFTGFLTDPTRQLEVGYVSCLLVVAHLLINLSLMLMGSLTVLLVSLKRLYHFSLIRKQKLANSTRL
jgi:hypothetical protein